MNTTIRLTQNGFVTYAYDGITAYISGKPLCRSLNQLPKSLGGGKYVKVYRGNCAGAYPTSFATLEEAVDAAEKISTPKDVVKFFKDGNYWFATLKGGKLELLEKPIGQLL